MAPGDWDNGIEIMFFFSTFFQAFSQIINNVCSIDKIDGFILFKEFKKPAKKCAWLFGIIRKRIHLNLIKDVSYALRCHASVCVSVRYFALRIGLKLLISIYFKHYGALEFIALGCVIQPSFVWPNRPILKSDTFVIKLIFDYFSFSFSRGGPGLRWGACCLSLCS